MNDNDIVTKKAFEDLEGRVKAIEVMLKSGKPDVSLEKSESLAEFLRKKDLKNDTDRTVCIAYFIEMAESRGSEEGVHSKDVAAGFRNARCVVPSNVSDQLARCAKRGLIQEGGKKEGKKAWTLTNTGITHVEDLDK